MLFGAALGSLSLDVSALPLATSTWVAADPAASVLASGVQLPFAAVVARDLNGPADGSWPLLMERHLDPGARALMPSLEKCMETAARARCVAT